MLRHGTRNFNYAVTAGNADLLTAVDTDVFIHDADGRWLSGGGPAR
jgi:hypothetical protein